MRGEGTRMMGGSLLGMILAAGASAMVKAHDSGPPAAALEFIGGYSNGHHSWTKTRKRKGWQKPGGSQNAKAARRVRA